MLSNQLTVLSSTKPYQSKKLVVETMAAGFDDYVCKPIKIVVFQSLLNAYYNK
ncbi:MAG: hypothetical protein OEZ58_22840 [Gammaproteobacteria bacterium]|nr:hypothetical protein [Gammaproteobacteria bacterium]MDH5731830.1 hypothetical protein [Gammaproteobacteria bacterium]